MLTEIIKLKKNKKSFLIRETRSFVSRTRKLSIKKCEFINKYWSKFGINFVKSYLNINDFFDSYAPLILEIGFGTGDSFSKFAFNNTFKNFLGIEVYLPGIASCLEYINLYRLKNVRVICHDAVEVLKYMIYDSSLYKVQIFFPDPWPKKRHRKRRIFTKNFAKLILKKLVVNGILHISTDCQSYAEEISSIVNEISGYINLSTSEYDIRKNSSYPITKFERKSIHLGNTIFHLMFKSV
ncbi:MAG: tRNA (guanosine(46)-N7)-methyltransferase TrmB [Buchnera aphidicola (Schlechtendalia peitan)]